MAVLGNAISAFGPGTEMPSPTADLFVDLLVAYFAGFILLWCLHPLGKFRRVVDIIYQPLVWLGLRHGWSMFAPDVPDATRIIIAGAVFTNDEFEVIPLPKLEDGSGFGRARNLRFITFQFKLGKDNSDYLKPALCNYALNQWHASRAMCHSRGLPVAIELREYAWASSEPGSVDATNVTPTVRTVWRHEVTA